jgi:hypothetical protein
VFTRRNEQLLRASDYASNAFVDRNQPWMGIGIFVPTHGCWKITGHYNRENLSYVVRVVP